MRFWDTLIRAGRVDSMSSVSAVTMRSGSLFGLRFQGEGYFLTDARTHRGTSGAPS